MAITIIDILGTDNVGASRTTINQNFQALKVGVEDIQGYIDSGANTITLTDGAVVPVNTIVMTGSSGLITARGLDITTALGIINAGPLTVAGVSQLNNTLTVTGATALQDTLAVTGNASFSGHTIYDSIVASDVFTDNVYQGSGSLDPTGAYYIALDYTNSTVLGTEDLLILAAGTAIGQRVILSIEGLTGGTTSGFIDISGVDAQPLIQVGGSVGTKIELPALYANVELYWNGLYWILIGGHGYTVVV